MRRTTQLLRAFIQWILNALKGLPYILRALWLFFPGILFLLLGSAVFWHLGQGKDVIRHCLEQSRLIGAITLAGLVFWVFVTWYTARLVAYNHQEFFDQKISTSKKKIAIGKTLLFHGPRLIAFFIFAVFIIALLQFEKVEPFPRKIIWSLLLLQFGIYVLLNRLLRKYDLEECDPAEIKKLIPWRNAARVLVGAATIVIIIFWGDKTVLATMIFLLQIGLLFLVIVRRPIARCQLADPAHRSPRVHFLDRYLQWIFSRQQLEENNHLRVMKEVERSVFVKFNLLALVCMGFYFAAVFSLSFARFIGPLAFVFLAFGILLGVGNFAGLLSKRIGTNLFFIAIALVFLVGLFTEPHRVRLIAAEDTASVRPRFRDYLRRWVFDSVRYEQLKKTTAEFPVFFVLADGGASRSGYWTASVLGRLTDETKDSATPFYQHLFCLSGASGGSVGNGTFLAALAHRDSLLQKGSTGFRKTAIDFLGSDFLSFTLARMLGPDLIAPVTYLLFRGDRAWALEHSLEHPQQGQLLAQNMQAPFSRFYPDMNPSHFLYPIIVFNTTRMQDGNPGVVANFNLDATFGSRLDVIDSMPTGEMLRLSTGMILSARFPYISPAGRIRTSYFVDGGYFDNSGAGIVHEMLLEISRIKRDSLMRDIAPLLDKLRFYVVHITNSPYGSENFKKVHPFNNDLAAPLLTLAGSYASQTNVNNNRLENYLKELNKDTSYIQFNLYKPDVKEEFPMNWVISEKLRNAMNERVDKIDALDSLIRRLNRGDANLFRDLNRQSAPNASAPAITADSTTLF